MPYADPTKSVAVACRHLFRNLKNAEALRRNPLVASFFPPNRTNVQDTLEALASISDAIREAAVTLAPCGREGRGGRHRMIIERCELSEDPPGIVAADLGLSTRQLYRERQLARLKVGMELQLANTRRGRWTVSDQGEYGIAQAALFNEFGQNDKARSILAEIAESTTDVESRCAALCSLSEITFLDGDVARSARLLALARGKLDTTHSVLSGQAGERVRLNVDITTATRLFLEGQLCEPKRLLEVASPTLTQFVSSREQRGLDLAFRSAILRACIHEQEGRSDLSLACADAGRHILDQMHSPTPLQTIDLAVSFSDACRVSNSPRIPEAREELNRALTAARGLGLLRRATGILLTMCDSQDAEACNRERIVMALALAVAHGSRALIAQAKLWAAQTDEFYGKPVEALEHLRAATSQFRRGDIDWRVAKIVECRAAFTLGDLSSAQGALSEAGTGGSESLRYQGSVLAQTARLHHLQRQPVKARETIRAALNLLNRHGRVAEITSARRIEAAIEAARR
jgi:hypothetical protein